MYHEEFKLYKLNATLSNIHNEIKNKNTQIPNNNDDNNISQTPLKDVKYHFRIVLQELIHNPRIHVEKNIQRANIPPQQLFLSNLFSNKKIKYDYHYLGDLICPCVNKNLWFQKSNLITNRILKFNIKLDDLEMTDILKHCPHPKICLDPNRYIIKKNPQLFVETINNLRKDNDIFNYVFNFWQYISMYDINNDAVYKLHCDVHQIDEKCIQENNSIIDSISNKRSDIRNITNSNIINCEDYNKYNNVKQQSHIGHQFRPSRSLSI